MGNRKTVFSGNGYAGRTFFFFGRAAKKLEDLPTLDERVYRIEPGTRSLKGELDSLDPKVLAAVDAAARELNEKGLVEDAEV